MMIWRGDMVQITKGPHKGRIGTVVDVKSNGYILFGDRLFVHRGECKKI